MLTPAHGCTRGVYRYECEVTGAVHAKEVPSEKRTGIMCMCKK